MRTQRIFPALCLLLVLGLAPGMSASQETETASSALLLTGETWQGLSADTKTAYIWGLGNLLAYEREMMTEPEAERKSFIPLLIQGMAGKPMHEVVSKIDAYYAEHPDQLKRPVIDAICHAMVFPAWREQRAAQ